MPLPRRYIEPMDILVSTLESGAASLASYLAAHVLLCVGVMLISAICAAC